MGGEHSKQKTSECKGSAVGGPDRKSKGVIGVGVERARGEEVGKGSETQRPKTFLKVTQKQLSHRLPKIHWPIQLLQPSENLNHCLYTYHRVCRLPTPDIPILFLLTARACVPEKKFGNTRFPSIPCGQVSPCVEVIVNETYGYGALKILFPLSKERVECEASPPEVQAAPCFLSLERVMQRYDAWSSGSHL